jgi:hypothetical protein
MKKLSLLFAMIAFLAGNVFAQTVIIDDDMEAYTVGNKIAVEAQAAGHDYWTTWSNAPGGSEDGVVAEMGGTKCGHLTYGNDQIVLLGGMESSHYEVQFDMYVPTGKDAYNNILHIFNGQGSQWATEVHYNHSTNGTQIEAGGNTYTFTFPFDTWFTVKYDIDLDNDVAIFYVGGTEICTWQFSKQASGTAGQRKLDAIDFYPPTSASVSEYYVDNVKLTLIGGVSVPHLTITPDAIEETVPEDDATTVDITIANSGTAMGDWHAWVDFGQGGAGTQSTELKYHDGEAYTGIGSTGGPYAREMAIRLPGAVYGSAAMGMKISKVKFLTSTQYASADNTYTFRIYGEGFYNQPGVKLAETVVTSSALGTWLEATFTEDVYMTGQTMWATVGLMQTAGEYPLTMDGGEYGQDADGNWLSTQGGSFDHCYSAGSFGGAWLITVECQGALIPGSWASLSAIEGSIAGGETQTVVMTLNTIGLDNGTYNATLFIETNDEDLEEVQIPVVLHAGPEGIIETAEGAFNIYPNPTTGMVTVEGENISAVAIYSAAGQLLNVVTTTTVDMSVYGAGVYFFNVIDNANNTTVQRVVVK